MGAEIFSAPAGGSHAAPLVVVEVDDRNADRLRYLADLGLTPATPIQVVKKAPFDGPLTLLVGEPPQEQIVDSRLARLIQVEVT